MIERRKSQRRKSRKSRKCRRCSGTGWTTIGELIPLLGGEEGRERVVCDCVAIIAEVKEE